MKISIKHRTNHVRITAFSLLSFFVLQLINSLLFSMSASAIVAAPKAKISFTFDDGLASNYTVAAPTLAKYGIKGTSYVTTSCIGTSGTCRANTDGKYMSWSQVSLLKSLYGWEIGSHSATHPYLATSDAEDGQPNVLTPAQVDAELSGSKATLAAHGFDTVSFSSPYGDYTNATLAQIAKYYSSHRGFAEQNNNTSPYNDYLLNNMQVQAGVTVAQVKAKIDQAVATNSWIILTFHDILARPSTDPDDYQYSTSELDQIASYAKAKMNAGTLSSTLVKDGVVSDAINLLSNGSFSAGLTGGWTTDNASAVTADTATNGSFPEAKSSIKFKSVTQSAHLFSPQVNVSPNTNYVLKNFLNVQTLASNEVGFYIDEYASSGAWISGQYRAAERSAFVESLNFNYKPTSQLVSKARLQVIIPGNSGIAGFFDNARWYASTSTTPPVAPNLIANGTFDQGITNGWTTDSPATVTADTTNHGAPENVQNSVKLAAGTTKNAHLFSPSVAVDSTKKYLINSYLNITQRTTSEIGFYIDEYDANGTWVSGKYISSAQALGAQTVGFFYTPTSATVKKAVLQVIVPTNSGIQAYYDNVVWTLQQ